MGHGRSTTTKALVTGLRKLGVRCDERLRQPVTDYPDTAIVKFMSPHNHLHRWHWVCIVDNEWHDPSFDIGGRLGRGRCCGYLFVMPKE